MFGTLVLPSRGDGVEPWPTSRRWRPRTRSENPSMSTHAMVRRQNFCPLLWCRLEGALEASGNTAALRKAAGVSCNSRCTPGTASAPDSLQQPCAPARVHKTKPRGRSRCTSTREAPRNKSRGRADRTLVLGCCGAAAQNAGSRPGLPLIAPDTRRFQPTPHEL